MPIETEDATERLKPERIGKPSEDLSGATFTRQIDDDFADNRTIRSNNQGGAFPPWSGSDAYPVWRAIVRLRR